MKRSNLGRLAITALLLALATACHVDPQDPSATVERNVTTDDAECIGADCDDVEGSATFCAGDQICYRPTKGYRLATTLPNGQKQCPPGFNLIALTPPNVGRTNACHAADALAWPMECEVGCQGGVRLPVQPVIANGCCTYDYIRDCDPAPMCVAADDATEG